MNAQFMRRRIRNASVMLLVLARRVVVGALAGAESELVGVHDGLLAAGRDIVSRALQRSQEAAVFAAGQFDGVVAVASVCRHGDGRRVCAARRAGVAARDSGNAVGGAVFADGGERRVGLVSDADDSGATGSRGRRGHLRANPGVSSAGSAAGGRRGARVGHASGRRRWPIFTRRGCTTSFSGRADGRTCCGRRRRCAAR